MELTQATPISSHSLSRAKQGLLLLSLLITSFGSTSSWSNSSEYQLGSPSDWVVVQPSKEDSTIDVHELAKRGIFYRLFDKQFNAVDPYNREIYTALEFELTSPIGVKNNSTIEIEFDPNYESIVLHEIGVIRDGVYLDKIDTERLQVFRTEGSLDELFYYGTKTLTSILLDVRVGDVIRYSYTRMGDNPVFGDVIEYRKKTQYNIPIATVAFRLLVNSETPMVIRQRDNPNDLDIAQTTTNGVRIYSWTTSSLNALKYVDNVNSWLRRSPAFSISTASSWKSIVDWSLPKYSDKKTHVTKLQEVAEKIKQRNPYSKAAQIGAALQWVQNEIRYFGVELGDNSHNPSPPEETLARRFGDCKDKTVVLIALLDVLGIESHPALVNSSGRLRNDANIRRLHAFDHVIVHVTNEGKSHWIDPTRENQRGALGDFYEPDYGQALIISEGNDELTKMSSEQSTFNLKITKHYQINKEDDSQASLTIRSQRKGLSAEYHREDISNHGVVSLSEDYLDYYRQSFDSIEADGKMRYEEFPRNSSYTYEKYAIQNLWSHDDDIDDNNSYFFEVEADETIRYLKAPKAVKYRKVPYAQNHPNNITEVSLIKLNTESPEDYASETIENKYFTFTVEVNQKPNKGLLVFTHQYKSHSKTVPVEDLELYVKDINRAQNLTSFYIGKDGFDFPDDVETEPAIPAETLTVSDANSDNLRNVLATPTH